MENKIVVSPAEETLIKFDGNFDEKSYSKNLKIALFKSLEIDKEILIECYREWCNGCFVAVCEKK
tara:strand:+ start:17 stop:211 length:195 start_codon:yes stop_codon:yes gene_type:complete